MDRHYDHGCIYLYIIRLMYTHVMIEQNCLYLIKNLKKMSVINNIIY